MRYIFAMLVVLNACVLGYYVLTDGDTDETSIIKAKSSLTKEITFKNSSKDIPPMIGEVE